MPANSPNVVIDRIVFKAVSVNQSFPSGPAVMRQGEPTSFGSENSRMLPIVEIRAIRGLGANATLSGASTNQRLPSGPVTIPIGRAWLVDMGKHREGAARRLIRQIELE